jgi:tetratricopeptide (TPR) repeat protein
LAVALSQTKRRPKEAIAAGERAVELAPHQADSHYALGVAADAAKHREQAAASFEQALALDPQHSPSHNALARQRLRASRFGRAGNLADAAAGFRASVQTDPTARYAVHNLELALRVFLARVSYLILLTAYVGIHATRDTLADRVGPLVLLAIPVTYAVRFDRRLAPDLRRHVRYIAVHGKLALPSTAQACAVTALFAAAVVRGGARTDLLGAAFVLALAARIVLALDVRRHQRRRRR